MNDEETMRVADQLADLERHRAEDRARIAELERELEDAHRQLLDDTYRPEGGEIVLGKLREVRAEVERLRDQLDEWKQAKDEVGVRLTKAEYDRDELQWELDELRAVVDQLDGDQQLCREIEKRIQTLGLGAVDSIQDMFVSRLRLALLKPDSDRVRDSEAIMNCSPSDGTPADKTSEEAGTDVSNVVCTPAPIPSTDQEVVRSDGRHTR